MPKIGKGRPRSMGYVASASLMYQLQHFIMKKAILIIAFFAVLLVSASAYTDRFIDTTAGSTAPVFAVTNNDNTASVDQARGKYLLLTFWASDDANSRIRCNEYQTLLRSHDFSGQLQVISVNFDRSKKLFEEIVRKDNLDAKSQFYVQGDKAAKLIDDYRLKDGYQTFLVDPQGRVAATNPSPSLLADILSH